VSRAHLINIRACDGASLAPGQGASGDESADLKQIAGVYAGGHGKHPAQQGCIAFAATAVRDND